MLEEDLQSVELASLALRLIQIGVNTACDEWFLSIVHSKARNRLDPERVTGIVQVKTGLYSRQPSLVRLRVAGSLVSFEEPFPHLDRVPKSAPDLDEI